MNKADTVIGAGAFVGGSTGLTVQVLTSYGSLLILAVNGVLAIGGLYLLWLRIKKARRELE